MSSPAGEAAEPVTPAASYLVCATPRSGSTLLCETLLATGVAGRPREYFEELKETGVPRRPREYFWGLRSPEVLRLLPAESDLDRDNERQSSWSREDYAGHLQSALLAGTTPNGVFASKMMWGYFPDFLELMRGIPRFSGMGDGSLLNSAFPECSLRVHLAQRQGSPGGLFVACTADLGLAQIGRSASRGAARRSARSSTRSTRSTIFSSSSAATRTHGEGSSFASDATRCSFSTRKSPATRRAPQAGSSS